MDKIIAFFSSFMTKILKTGNKNINKNIDSEVSNSQHTISGMSKVVAILEDKVVEPFKVTETTNKKEIKAMYRFGNRSRARLDTCHPDMIKIMEEVIKIYDISVLEGLRTAEKQLEYFETGRSKLDGVKKLSKHQDHGDGLSYAVDIMPYKKGSNAFSGAQKDLRRFYYLAGLVKMAARQLLEEGKISHTVRWGGDWDSDDIYTDQNFDDLPHFELRAI